MSVQLLPVIEGGFIGADWSPPRGGDRWIVLSGETSDDDIVRVIGSIAGYGTRIGVQDTLRATTAAVADASSTVVAGGLLFRAGDFVIEPGCCCGIETWREWYGVKKDGQSPWLGHDPMAWIDCSGDAAVVWSDEANGESATVAYAEIRDALGVAASDLAAFVGRLRDWSLQNNTDPRLAETIKRNYSI